MKIDELIEELEAVKQEHGNQEIFIFSQGDLEKVIPHSDGFLELKGDDPYRGKGW